MLQCSIRTDGFVLRSWMRPPTTQDSDRGCGRELVSPLPACTTVVLQSRKAARQLHAYSNRALVEVARNLDALSRLPASHALITHLRIGSVARQSSVSTSIIPGRWRSSSSGTQAPRIAFIDTGRLTFHRGLAWHTTDETLREGFQPFGSVEEAVGNG